MKTKYLLCILMLLVLTNCKETEVVPVPTAGTNASARLLSTDCDVINFSNATGLISSVTSEDGVVVGVTSHNPNTPSQPIAAMIFNSNNPPRAAWETRSEDLDLGTPNQAYGGPGEGAGGTTTNNTPLGNIVVLQNFNQYGTATPNDDDVNTPGGYITFTFPSLITATSIQVIDVEAEEREGGTVVLYGGTGNIINTIPIPITGENGVATINLGNTANVKSIRLNIVGSMGFDNLAFCSPTTPPGNGCTHTQGYWKNHPEAWDVQSLMIGSLSYTKPTLITVLKTPPKKGNGLLILAHQLIAAKLNIADGAYASAEVVQAIAAADALIGNLNLQTGYLPSSQVSALATYLDEYNNGRKGTSHCAD